MLLRSFHLIMASCSEQFSAFPAVEFAFSPKNLLKNYPAYYVTKVMVRAALWVEVTAVPFILLCQDNTYLKESLYKNYKFK